MKFVVTTVGLLFSWFCWSQLLNDPDGPVLNPGRKVVLGMCLDSRLGVEHVGLCGFPLSTFSFDCDFRHRLLVQASAKMHFDDFFAQKLLGDLFL